MADQEKVGTVWQDDELDAIVSDYFDMLNAELSGRPYIKARHSAALMQTIGRTHRSVEFKHQNISAVLDELGLPWIPGYIPKRNYQNAIFGAIERYLIRRPEILDFVPKEPREASNPSDIFIPPPQIRAGGAAPKDLQQLVRKFDPMERDRRNRALGAAGESFVVELERQRLHRMARQDLAREVRWVSNEDGDGAGYDVRSFDPDGSEKLIEVKTTNGSARTPFFLTRNEHDVSLDRAAHWCIYRVHLFAKQPRVFVIAPPLESVVNLTAELWRAWF